MNKKNVFITLTAGCLLVIFMMSCLSSITSEAISNSVAEKILSEATEYQNMSYGDQMVQIDAVDTFVRGMAQILIFTFLGFCMSKLLSCFQVKNHNVSAFVLCVGTVVVSELYQQFFIMGRYFSMSAMILGTAGSLLGVFMSVIPAYYRKQISK